MSGATPREPHTIGDVPSGAGSPLTKHPGKRVPVGDFRPKFQSQLQATYNSYTALKQSSMNHQRSASRKREHQTQSKSLMNMPTQSPLQKTGRLQSVVSVVRKEPPKGDNTP